MRWILHARPHPPNCLEFGKNRGDLTAMPRFGHGLNSRRRGIWSTGILCERMLVTRHPNAPMRSWNDYTP